MSRRDFTLVPDVHVTDILLDVENARIRAGRDQADCISRILRKEDQLMTLMESIAREGLSTIPVLVSPNGNDQWVVRDGNRRVTALKLLNDPELCPEARLKPRIRALANKHRGNIEAIIDVLASDDGAAVFREVVARHSGAQGGAGQLDWTAYLRTVYVLHNGHPAEYKRPAQYVFWAEEQGLAVDDDFPISTVQRFFTVANLSLLGFKVDKDELVPTIPVATAKAMAQRVINDFQLGRERGGKSVDDIRTPDQAKAYIAGVRIAAGLAPESETTESPSSSLTGRGRPPKASTAAAPIVPAVVSSHAAAPTPKTSPFERGKLFGRGSPNIAIPEREKKAAMIVSELRLLSVKETPLAVAGLLRHLIELSDEHYRKKHRLPDKTYLHKNVLASATHMRDSDRLNKAQFDVVSRFASGGANTLLHIETLQKIMHRDTHFPTYQLLNALWDSIAEFVRACWLN